MNKQNGGWIFGILGVVIAWKPAVFLIRSIGRFPKSMPLFRRLIESIAMFATVPKMRLFLGLMLFITGIILIVVGREKRKYWEVNGGFRINRAMKKIQVETDLNVLNEICRFAGQRDIAKAAKNRKIKILYQCLESGENLETIRMAVKDTIAYGMYDTVEKDFLAVVAKKRPEIIKEFWPDLQKWAHQDSKSHTDNKPGIHIDRTEYYDYFLYPDGRRVPNRSGRRRHTDTRTSYGDCHDDYHKDSSVHNDNPHAEKIVRFKPYIPKEDAGS